MSVDAALPASEQVLCPVVVGRAREVGVIHSLIAQAGAGRGAVLAIVGEAGIGKSRMVREAEAAAGPGGLGMLVLKGRAVGGGRAVPFRAVAEAIQGAVRDAGWPESGELPAFLPALHRLLDATSPDAPREESPLLLHEAVLRLLRLLAGRARGALLVLEDLHWAASDPLPRPDYLADHLSAERILAILTLRDNPGPPLDLIEELAGRRV